ncbi:MAG: hypothetical protein HY791_18380 [Deltaproteobacteria bacterium]|nr:hypothetical protein [Deltaproteobacteria bacterium]
MSFPLLLIGFSDPAETEGFVRRVVAGHDVLPSLLAVQEAAENRLGVEDEDDARSAGSRARTRGWIPRVDVAVGTDAGLDIRDSLTGATNRIATTDKRGFGVEVGLRFELGELLFSDSELRASRTSLARAASVRLVRERATELYFKRVEVLLEQKRLKERCARGDSTDEPRLLELAIEAARLDGRLRALTGPIRPRPQQTKGDRTP